MQLLVQAEKEASLIPEGMRVLPEEERLEMLGLLEASKADTEARIRVNSKCVSFVPTERMQYILIVLHHLILSNFGRMHVMAFCTAGFPLILFGVEE